jgi:hypothetical protein
LPASSSAVAAVVMARCSRLICSAGLSTPSGLGSAHPVNAPCNTDVPCVCSVKLQALRTGKSSHLEPLDGKLGGDLAAVEWGRAGDAAVEGAPGTLGIRHGAEGGVDKGQARLDHGDTLYGRWRPTAAAVADASCFFCQPPVRRAEHAHSGRGRA